MSKLGARLNEIHGRLIEGSRTASLDLFREALDPILGYLMRAVDGITEDDAHDCAMEAIIGHINQPDTFDPAKSSLWTFLCMIAQGDARDTVRKRLDHDRLMEKHGYNIELWGGHANKEYEQSEWKKDAEKIMRLHGDFIVQNDGERRVLDLILDGERAVSAYAEALGLDPKTDVAAEVKRVKDRINLRLKKVGDEI
jgi:DNA-directed RNA polymerase specialized sigma24 family protein